MHPWLEWTGTRVSGVFPSIDPRREPRDGLFYRRLCAQLAFVSSSPLLHKARAVFRIAHLEHSVGILSSHCYTSSSVQLNESGSFSIDLAAKIGVALGAALSASGDVYWENWVRISIVSSRRLPVSHPDCSWTSVRPSRVVLGGRRSALDTASTTSPRVPARPSHVATTARRRPHYSAMLTDGVRNPVPVSAHFRRLCSLSQHLRHVHVALDHSLPDPPNVQPLPYLDTNATLRARFR